MGMTLFPSLAPWPRNRSVPLDAIGASPTVRSPTAMGALERGYKRREPRALGFVPFAATAGGNTPHNTEGREDR
jgi:hypothetical protein